MTRRRFLKLAMRAGMGITLGGLAYGVRETERVRVKRLRVALPNLPEAFHGTTIAFLSDIHHSRVVPRTYLEEVVEMTNALAPHFVVLGGDYVTAGHKYGPLHGPQFVEPCFEILRELRATGGKLAVTGNHDKWAGLKRTRDAMAKAGFLDVTNGGVWVERAGARLRMCGIGDLWTQKQDLAAALGGATENDAVILASHNPDYAEQLRDARVRLMLSGHTHGGQIVLPFFGAPRVPSRYGQKYRYGLVEAPCTRVYVTSGVGVLPLALRFHCRPEIALLTLERPA